VPIPIPLLNLAAYTNLAAAKLLGYAPMLTPGKVREITHEDWLCDNSEFTQVTGWQPAFGLEQGLSLIFNKNIATLQEIL
jgi:nucleoside-diphosphate-sugar epimerase